LHQETGLIFDKIEENLKELFGELPYRALVKEIKDFAIFHLDARGHILSWNEGAQRLFGYSENEIVNQYFSIIFTPEDIAEGVPEEELRGAESEGQAEDVRWHSRKDGTRFFANGVTTALRDASGALRGFAKIARDDTERKLIEEELAESNRHSSNILESITDAFYAIDRDWRFAYLNKQAEFLLQRKREELLGKNIWEEFPEAVGTLFYEQYHKVIAEAVPVSFEAFYAPLDGWFEVRGYPSPDGLSVYFQNISERKYAEEALRKSEEKYRTLFDSIDEGFCVIEVLFDENEKPIDYRFLEINPSFEKLTNISAEDALSGKTVRELVPNLEEKWFEIYGRIALTDEGMRFVEVSTAMGRWFDVYAFRVEEPESRRVAILFNNITERKQIEKELHEANTRLQSTLNAGEIATWMFDITNDRVYADKNLARLFALSDEEAKGGRIETYIRTIHKDDRDYVSAAIARAIETTGYYETEYRIVLPDGSIRWVIARGNVQRDEKGNAVSMPGVIVDISERKQAEEALLERARLAALYGDIGTALTQGDDLQSVLGRCTEALVQHLDVAFARIWTLNAIENVLELQASAGMYTHLNGAHARVPVGKFKIGMIAEERLPHLTNEVLSDSRVSDKEWAQREGMVSFAGYPLIVEERLVGVVCVFARQPLTDVVLQAMASISHGIAGGIERKRIEEERRLLLAGEQELRRQAEEANKIKDEFLAMLSHELRTPLNAILGWSNLLRGGQLDTEGSLRALETIERNARSQSQLIDDLLDISRIITGKLRLEVRPIELSSIIEASVDAVRPAAEAKNIRLQVLLDSGADAVSGDADRLQQIVWNLLTNAVKFTPKDGRVQVRLERVNSHVEITVSDTGKGIEPEFLPHVFDRFRQADQSSTRRYGGLGLGLSIVRQLTEMHGGSVSAQSEGEGKGTSFTVKLPRRISVPSMEKTGEARVHPTAGGSFKFECAPELSGLSVLVVDDEADARELLRQILEGCGSQVITAGSAAEAIAAFENAPPDILVSDIGMPDEDGYSLIRRIRALPADKGGRTPAIALTAYARVEDRVRALTAGFQVHVPKPIEPVELAAVVASLAGRIGQA
jgi:PAS domain S-box-containing protein